MRIRITTQESLSWLLIFFLGFTVGVSTGIFIVADTLQRGFQFSKNIGVNIDPTSILSILATIFLAIYVTRSLSRRNEEERTEKDLLIDDLKNFKIDITTQIIGMVAVDKVMLIEITDKFKNFRTKLASIMKLVKKYGFVSGDSQLSKKIDDKLRDIKDLLTDTPRNGSSPSGIKIIGGEVEIDALHKQEIRASMNEMEELMFGLIVVINRKK